jgi:hypothetical protein
VKEIESYHKNILNTFNPLLNINKTPKVTISNKIKQNNLDIHFAIRNLNYKNRLEDMLTNITEKIQAR